MHEYKCSPKTFFAVFFLDWYLCRFGSEITGWVKLILLTKVSFITPARLNPGEKLKRKPKNSFSNHHCLKSIFYLILNNEPFREIKILFNAFGHHTNNATFKCLIQPLCFITLRQCLQVKTLHFALRLKPIKSCRRLLTKTINLSPHAFHIAFKLFPDLRIFTPVIDLLIYSVQQLILFCQLHFLLQDS